MISFIITRWKYELLWDHLSYP